MRTGLDFNEEHTLRDGTRVVLRFIRHEDLAALKDGFSHLSQVSRYHRFNGQVKELSNQMLHFFVDVDGLDHVALVATTPPMIGISRGLAVARFIRDPKEPSAAEFAITVTDEMQHKGLGGVIAVALAHAASERGVRLFRGIMAYENTPIRRLLAELGPLTMETIGTECMFEVKLPAATAPELQVASS